MTTILSGIIQTLARKKKIQTTSFSSMKPLSTLDLTSMGIGATLGVGVYVLAGEVAKQSAGPSVIISFAIAAIGTMFAGLCYAEFGARVPKAGSAYIYSYVTMGELMAFIIGWTVILEYMIGSASIVRVLSNYVDKATSNVMSRALESAVPLHGAQLSPYFDFFALSTTIVFSMALAFGAKGSSLASNIFTLVNLSVVLFVICAGSAYATVSNWNLAPSPSNHGSGGFMPYGIMGIFKGAARCFYGFVGFDCVVTGEGVKNPKKSIPIAIVTSITVAFCTYCGISVVLTMVLPYYEQNEKTPLIFMFDYLKWTWPAWLVTIGAICALCASLLGTLYSLPRVIYAMASDGLVFKSLGNINSSFRTPMVSTLVSGCLTGILAAIFEFEKLRDLSSIAVLLAYSIVAACVLILRYEETEDFDKSEDRDPITTKFILKQLINANNAIHPTKLTSQLVSSLVALYFILSICISIFGKQFWKEVQDGNEIVISIMVFLMILLIITLICIYLQPATPETQLSFAVPFVPFIPGISILSNIALMMILQPHTWIQFSIWMTFGMAIYVFYGMRNSNLRENISKVLPK